MPMFKVSLTKTVSTMVEVEAKTADEAINLAYDSPNMPGSITVGAFGGAGFVDDGEWEPYSVEDETGETVWTEDGS
jgi:hypothetical protein